MPYYIFVWLKLTPLKWELLEVIKNPRTAEFALSEYERILGAESATAIKMVMATSEASARIQLANDGFDDKFTDN